MKHPLLEEREERRKRLQEELEEDDYNTQYEARVQKLEDEGLTRSDAQGVVDAQDMNKALSEPDFCGCNRELVSEQEQRIGVCRDCI